MSWIENMSINIFPMVLVMVVFVSNRFKFGKTISARVFDLIIVFDFFLMLVDIVGVAVCICVPENINGWCGQKSVGCGVCLIIADGNSMLCGAAYTA